MIIEFSGGDGTGKSTALKHFCDVLEFSGKRVLRTREVGNPHIEVCRLLREIVLDPNRNLDGRSMEFVFAAQRIENQRFYDSVRDDYDFIVSDRGWLCHTSYTDHNVSKEFTKKLYLDLLAGETYMPDRIYLFEVDQDIAESRRGSRDKATDAIEKKGSEFQRRVAESYRKYANQLPLGMVRLINTDRPIEEVQRIMEDEARLIVNG